MTEKGIEKPHRPSITQEEELINDNIDAITNKPNAFEKPFIFKTCFGVWYNNAECRVCDSAMQCKATLFVGW